MEFEIELGGLDSHLDRFGRIAELFVEQIHINLPPLEGVRKKCDLICIPVISLF
jgi:hypothetical protein